MKKVYTPVALRFLLRSGRDVMACLACDQERMKLVKTLINHHGVLIDIAQTAIAAHPKKKDRMQQIIKMPDQMLNLLIPKNRGCFWVRDAMLFPQKILIQKTSWSFFSKINVQKMHRKPPLSVVSPAS
ncbi:MAG: hypothetical protein ABIN48_14810 [Ginsengibacter sp.]